MAAEIRVATDNRQTDKQTEAPWLLHVQVRQVPGDAGIFACVWDVKNVNFIPSVSHGQRGNEWKFITQGPKTNVGHKNYMADMFTFFFSVLFLEFTFAIFETLLSPPRKVYQRFFSRWSIVDPQQLPYARAELIEWTPECPTKISCIVINLIANDSRKRSHCCWEMIDGIALNVPGPEISIPTLLAQDVSASRHTYTRFFSPVASHLPRCEQSQGSKYEKIWGVMQYPNSHSLWAQFLSDLLLLPEAKRIS